MQGRVPAGQSCSPEGQSSPLVALRHRPRAGPSRPPGAGRQRGRPGAGRSRLRAPSQRSRVCGTASQQCLPAGRMPGEGTARLSVPFPQRVSQRGFVAGSVFVTGLLLWSRVAPACPGLSALPPKGQLSRKIAQTTHLRLASFRLVPHSYFSLPGQTRGDK